MTSAIYDHFSVDESGNASDVYYLVVRQVFDTVLIINGMLGYCASSIDAAEHPMFREYLLGKFLRRASNEMHANGIEIETGVSDAMRDTRHVAVTG